MTSKDSKEMNELVRFCKLTLPYPNLHNMLALAYTEDSNMLAIRELLLLIKRTRKSL